MTVAPGTRLGIYSVKTRLGAGGMGEVFRATDTRLKRDVAIKVLPPQVSGDPTRLARFRREAELLASLNHPNIAHVNGLEEADGVIALVMELVEGEDLSTRLSQGPLAIGEALRIAHQVAAALDSAHEHGIIHRDLKPGNIRVRPDGMVKVLDFGLARSVAATGIDESTRTAISSTGAISGTPAYMSPEQARGTDTSRETDVWTFGVVVYELLTAVSPFARTSAADTLAAVLTAPVDESLIPKETPHSVRRLISRCLERDPQQRWRSMGDARLTIEDALTRGAGPGDTVRGTGSPTSVTRRRALVYGAASMALSATGFGVGTTLSRRGSPATAPSFRRLTFRRGLVRSARFAPDGETILYGALWDGEDCRIHAVRINAPESQPLDLPNANLLAVSRAGELAVALGPHRTGTITYGTLARVPMTGGAPRPLVEDVKFADWSPDSRDLAIVRRVDGRDRLEFPVGNVLFAPNLGEATGIGFPRVSSDGRHVAFIHYTSPGSISGRVALVNQAGTVTRLSEDSLNIHGLAWTRDAVLFTSADDRPLFRALRETTPSAESRTIARVPANLTLWDALADGRLVMAQTDDRGVMYLSVDGRERHLSWLDASWANDVSADGTMVLFTEYGQSAGADFAVYLRSSDGSQPVRLSPGVGLALSPDGRRALCRSTSVPGQMAIIPTGTGETQIVPGDTAFYAARWTPDGRRVVAWGVEAGRPGRIYLVEPETGATTAISAEGVDGTWWALSPNGSAVVVKHNTQSLGIYPLDGSPAVDVPGLDGHETPVDWINEGVLVMRFSDPAAALGQVYLLDTRTGRQVPWRSILLQEPAGIMHLNGLRATPDGRSYAYSWHLALSNLYLAEGLS